MFGLNKKKKDNLVVPEPPTQTVNPEVQGMQLNEEYAKLKAENDAMKAKLGMAQQTEVERLVEYFAKTYSGVIRDDNRSVELCLLFGILGELKMLREQVKNQ